MLSFDAAALSALYAQMNLALWPAQIAALMAAVAMLGLALGRVPLATRVVGLMLAAAWLCCGWVFLLGYFAGLSFTGPAYGGLFLAQAGILILALLLRGRPAFGYRPGPAAWGGLAAVAYALVVVPLMAVFGDGLATARIFALAPGPTAVFTLGLLLLTPGRCPLLPMLLPLLWTLVAGITAWSLAIVEDLALPLIGPALFILALWHNRQCRRLDATQSEDQR